MHQHFVDTYIDKVSIVLNNKYVADHQLPSAIFIPDTAQIARGGAAMLIYFTMFFAAIV